MTDEYEVIIEDIDPIDITKNELIETLNRKLSAAWMTEDFVNGFEIPVEPEWENILKEDGSILWSYHKLGWWVIHMRQEKRDGSVRQWLKFKNPNYKRGK